MTVSQPTAQKWNLKTIGDLAAHSPEVKFGAPSEFLSRTEGLPGLKAKYGLDVAPHNFVAISDGGGTGDGACLAGWNRHGCRHLQHLSGDPAE